MKHTKSKHRRGLITKVIVYRDQRTPSGRRLEVRADVRCDEVIDHDYAAAMVAVRTGTPLNKVFVIEVRDTSIQEHERKAGDDHE